MDFYGEEHFMGHATSANVFEGTGIQELNFDEIDEVNGAWIANAAGAALGAVGGAVTGYVSSGGSVGGAVAGGAAGAVAGALSPISGANSAARAITTHAARLGAGALAGGAYRLSQR